MNVNMTKKDILNAKNCSMPVSAAVENDWTLTVSGCAIVENGGTDKQGNPCPVGYIATDRGVFGFISSILIQGLHEFAEYLQECLDSGEAVEIKFISGKNKSGNEYFNFQIL